MNESMLPEYGLDLRSFLFQRKVEAEKGRGGMKFVCDVSETNVDGGCPCRS